MQNACKAQRDKQNKTQNKIKFKQNRSHLLPGHAELTSVIWQLVAFHSSTKCCPAGTLGPAFRLSARSSAAASSSFYLLSTSLSEQGFLAELWLTPADLNCPFRLRGHPQSALYPHRSLSPGDMPLGPAIFTSLTSACSWSEVTRRVCPHCHHFSFELRVRGWGQG